MVTVPELYAEVMSSNRAAAHRWAATPQGQGTAALGAVVHELTGRRPGPIRVLRIGTHMVLAAPQARLVMRVHAPAELAAVRRTLDLTTALTAEGAPVLAPLLPDPWMGERALVTVWPLGDVLPNNGPVPELARALAQLHAHRPPEGLSTVEVRSRLSRRLDALPSGVPEDVRRQLREAAAAAVELLDAALEGERVLLHGDANPGNAVVLDGKLRLIDLDGLTVGPRVFDLAPPWVAYRRFHRNQDLWERFAAAYGPLLRVDELERLRPMREATMLSWLASRWDESPRDRAQFLHRMSTLGQDPAEHAPWRAV